jgi:hypothetical protein
MRFLKITPEMVGRNRTVLSLAPISGMMLWPGTDVGDRARRAELMKATTALFIRDALNSVPTARSAAEMIGIVNGYDLARQAGNLGAIDRSTEQPFIHGCLAGLFFLMALEMHAKQGAIKLEYLKSLIVAPGTRRAEHFRGYRALDITSRTFQKIWEQYKHVGPLWGAYLASAAFGGQSTSPFPCSLGELPYFLGVVKLLETWGLTTPPPRRKEPLLDPKRLWRIPDGLPLPAYSRLRPDNLEIPRPLILQFWLVDTVVC